MHISIQMGFSTSKSTGVAPPPVPTLSSVSYDVPTTTLTATANMAGTLFYLVNDTAVMSGAAVAAAVGSMTGEAYGLYAVSVGANTDTPDLSGASAGDHYLHLVLYVDPDYSNVVSTLYTFEAPVAAGVELTHLETQVQPAKQTSAFTFTTSLGVAHADRHAVICLAYYTGSGTPTSVKLDGIEMVLRETAFSNVIGMGIYSLAKPTGTTGVITITPNVKILDTGLSVYRLIHPTGVPFATVNTIRTNKNFTNIDINTPANSVLLHGMIANRGITTTRTGETNDADMIMDGTIRIDTSSAALVAAETPHSIAHTYNPKCNSSHVTMVWS